MTCVYAPVSGTIACFDDLRQAFEDFKELLCEAFGWRRHQKRKIICKKCPCRNRLPDRRMTESPSCGLTRTHICRETG